MSLVSSIIVLVVVSSGFLTSIEVLVVVILLIIFLLSSPHLHCSNLFAYGLSSTRDVHAALHTWAWRPCTEAEVGIEAIEGTIGVSSKWPYDTGHLGSLYGPLWRLKWRWDYIPDVLYVVKK